MGRVWFVHCGCTRLMPSPTHATHSFRSSASTGGTHTLPFSPSSVFPKARARPALVSNSVNTGAGGAPQGAAISAFGQLRNQIWALHKEKSCLWLVKSNAVTPPYPRQRSGTQRSRCRIPPAQDKAQCRLNSLWHMCDLGPL